LKTVVPKGTGGSNPSCSVRRDENTRDAERRRGGLTRSAAKSREANPSCSGLSSFLPVMYD